MTATKERKTRSGGIRLSAPALKEALGAVASAVPGKSPRPILQNVLLSGGVLSGSDLEIRIDVEVDADPALTVLLPRDRLQAILGSVTADEITLTPDATSCVIAAGRGTWTLPTEDAAEYPTWEVVAAKPITRMPADQFCRAVKGVVFAADNESSRYALGAVLIEVKGDVVTFVATDGRRLASVTCEHDQAVDDSATLVPARVMDIIGRLAKNAGDAGVQLEATGKELVATVGTARVTALLIEGRFPRWRDVLPKRETKATVVARGDLFSATRAAAICTSEESRGVDYGFADGIWLHGQSGEKGESSITCEVLEAGKKCNVKLDPKFVLQWLTGIDGEEDPNVEIEAVDDQSAVVLRCGDNTGVIMPLAKD
jgi:DNA polymerase-3 subunit beta